MTGLEPKTGAKELPVSLVMTVRNEASSLPGLFASILAQTMRPADIVIVDGGSTDGTRDLVRGYMDAMPLRLVELDGANISEGRNAAIREARFEIVAVTDAGVGLDPRWLETITAPLLYGSGGADIVSGFFVPDAHTAFERAMGATVLPAVEDINPETFLPSSRSVALRKEAWARVGGYPEWLDYCEDLVFDIRLKGSGFQFVFAPGAVVYFRPRSSLASFYRQYYRYARGDGKADLWRKRHAIRYLTYLVGPIVALFAWRHRRGLLGRLLLALIATAAGAYVRGPYRRLLPLLGGLSPRDAAYAFALVPVIRLVGDAAKMVGYPVGVLWRLRRTRD